jgi:tape measure domain-containing protein
MQRFQGSVNSASRSVNQLGGTFDSLNNRMSTPLQKLRDYVLILGNIRFAILNVRDIAVGWVAALIRQSAEVERLTMLMTGLSTASTEFGKNQEAQRNLQNLYQMSRDTGYAVRDLADAFVKFKAGGLDPTNGSLQSLVDATARFGGTSETMHRAAVAIQQMSGKGVISMEELRQQLGEAVPTAIRDMARAMNKGVGDLVKEISEGKVKAGPALQALFEEWERMYSGSAKRMSQTLNGQLSELRTNIMETATFFTGLGNQDGIYGTTTKGLRELNQALQSGEARAAIVELGRGINSVMTTLIAGVQHIIRWREEYGTALKIVLTGIAMIMLKNFGTWMVGQWTHVASAWGMARTQLASASMAYMQLTGQVTNLSDARAVEAARAAHGLQVARAEVAISNQRLAALQSELVARQRENAAINQTVIAMEREARVARAVVVQGQAAGRFRDANTRRYISEAQAVNTLAVAENRLAATQRILDASNRQLAQSQAAVAAANTAATTAATAATAAQTRLAAATGFMATAARIGSAALGVLKFAFSALLGPIGMVIMVLVTLCSQLGLFTSRAQAARAAADDLRQGLVSLARVRAVEGQMKANDAANASDEAIANGTARGRFLAGRGDGPSQFIAYGEADRQAARQRIANRAAQNKELAGSIDAGKRTHGRAQVQGILDQYTGARENQAGLASQQYARDVETARQRYGEGTDKFVAAVKDARETRDRTVKQYDQALLSSARQNAAKGGAEGQWYARAFQDLEQQINGAGAAAGTAGPEIAGASDGAGKAAKGAASQLGNMAEQVAVLQARAAGTGEALAKFEAQLATGQLKGWTQAQIERGRVLAMQADALKDATKAAGSARQANESFDNSLASTAGQIAQLTAELGGAEGHLERFNAELAAGKYDGVTEDRIAQMRRYLTVIEQLEQDRDWNRATKRLDKEMLKQEEAASGLWDSWRNGTLEADRNLNRIRERYADIIEIAERAAAGGDPTKLQDINDRISAAATNQARADAVEVMDEWRRSTEEIRIGLMDEEAARQANFDREMERQIRLVDWTRLSSDQRIEAERRLEEYRKAAQARLARENESATVKMARDWAKLGQNIDASLAGAMSNFVDALVDGKAGFKDFAMTLVKELIKIIIRAMIAYAILSAIGMANNSAGQPVSFGDFMKGQISAGFGGSSDAGSTIGYTSEGSGSRPYNTSIPAPSRQGQAIVEQYDSLPRYHTGGWIGGRKLKAGEVPMVGQERELVLTERHQEILGKRMGGTGSAAAPKVEINFINNSGTSLDAEAGEPEFNGKDFVVNVVVEAVNKQGPLRDSLMNMRPGN